ncbi:MAG: hypothetical protein GXP53_00420 [Deltaproteobacteria bacterium]|nr:hypothetical protein [Deltaproteobacteria bacterium]
MPTAATIRALHGLRDLTMIKWYIIPLMAIVFYIYATEIKKAKKSGNWNAVFAGLTLFGMDCINETWNGWVYHFTGRSAVWTVPGDTAFRVMLGWNIEIIFMFAIGGMIYYYTISDDPKDRILGIPDWWFWAVAYSVFCVLVECLLNLGGHLVWEYEYWNLSFKGIWLIFFLGYFHFYVATLFVVGMKSIRNKIITVASLYGIAIIANVVAMGLLGWKY